MERTLAISAAPIPTTRKASARVALMDLREPAKSVLADCFRQFGIDAVPLSAQTPERLCREKFEACVVHLASEAQSVIEKARSSPSNSRMVVYGLGGSAQDALRLSKYGINAVFTEPLERQAALKLVRATHTLVLHEFRRYVRIPVVTEVSIVTSDARRYTATSQEFSSGGMSMKSAEEINVGTPLEVSFALLTLPRIWVRGTVSWRKNLEKTFGIRFDAQDERRTRIKEWIDAYLES